MIRKDAGLYCGPRLRNGEVSAYVGRNQYLEGPKGLVEADLGPGVYASAGVLRSTQNTPLKDHPVATHCEPSALYC